MLRGRHPLGHIHTTVPHTSFPAEYKHGALHDLQDTPSVQRHHPLSLSFRLQLQFVAVQPRVAVDLFASFREGYWSLVFVWATA